MLTNAELERFMGKIAAAENCCWHWTGALNSNGHGSFHVRVDEKLRQFKAHRVAYEQFVQPLAPGLVVHHHCGNRACVNPAHLEAMSMREASLLGEGPVAKNAAKTHCKHGHEFTPENTVINRRGNRECKECRRHLNRLHHDRMSRLQHSAREQVRWAIDRGDLVRPTICEECGEAGFIDGHHDDYRKPLEVRWLCRKCHWQIHKGVPVELA